MIAGSALVVFTILVAVSFASMYQSTYGSVDTVTAYNQHLSLTNDSLGLLGNLSVKNNGYLGEVVSILNKTFTIQPGSSNSTGFSVPLNLSGLYSGGWPIDNASLSISMLVKATSVVLKASKFLNLSVEVGAPFGGFNISPGASSNGVFNLTLSFKDLFRQALNLTNITAFQGNKSIGTVQLPVLVYGHSYKINGKFSLPGLSSGKNSANLTFDAGPFHWTMKNVTVR